MSINKKFIVAILIVLCSFSITACQDSRDGESLNSTVDTGEHSMGSTSDEGPLEEESIINSQEKSDQGGMMLTKEWIMEHYGLSEEEVQGFDIDVMIKHGFLANQEKTMSRYPTKEDFISSLPWLHEKAIGKEHAGDLKDANNYSYLLEGGVSFPESYEQIQYLGIESVWDDRQPNENDPTGKVSVLFDFVEKKAYYKTWDTSVLDDVRKADHVAELSTEDVEKVFAQLDEANFSGWPSFHTEEDVYDNWKYGIQTKDGEVFSNMVEGLPNNEPAWNLFNKLFSFSSPFPAMSK